MVSPSPTSHPPLPIRVPSPQSRCPRNPTPPREPTGHPLLPPRAPQHNHRPRPPHNPRPPRSLASLRARRKSDHDPRHSTVRETLEHQRRPLLQVAEEYLQTTALRRRSTGPARAETEATQEKQEDEVGAECGEYHV